MWTVSVLFQTYPLAHSKCTSENLLVGSAELKGNGWGPCIEKTPHWCESDSTDRFRRGDRLQVSYDCRTICYRDPVKTSLLNTEVESLGASTTDNSFTGTGCGT